jgi:hypothetical protein
MVHIRGKLPDLGRTQLGADVDARGIEHLAVDGPQYVAVMESLGKTELAREPSASNAPMSESRSGRLRRFWAHRVAGAASPPPLFFSFSHLPKRVGKG